jgi:hypothetical protein
MEGFSKRKRYVSVPPWNVAYIDEGSGPPRVLSGGRDGHGRVCRKGGEAMSTVKMVGIALIAVGILGLVYGGFSYTRETHEAKVGPLELSVSEKETVNVPVWAGVGAIVVGGLLLLVPSKSA